MLTPEERRLLPQIIEIWEKRLAKPVELTDLDRTNALIAIYEARQILKEHQEQNAKRADLERER